MTTIAENADTVTAEENLVQFDVAVEKNTFTHKIYTYLDAMSKRSKVALFEGKSGFGKTALIGQYAKDRNRPLFVFNVANRPSEDLVGHPRVVEITQPNGEVIPVTKYTMVDWLYKIITDEPNAIILFDEFKNADPERQAGLLNFLQDKEVDGYKIPDECLIVALCNPTDISSNGWDLSAPAANRFCHINWNFPSNEMIDLIQANFGKEMNEKESSVRADIAAYLNQNSGNLHNMPKNAEDQAYGWPSPRSWDNAAEIISELPEDESMILEVFAGYVGRAVASDYLNWKMMYEIPDVRKILVDGEQFPWNDESATSPQALLRFVHSGLGLVRLESNYWQSYVDFLIECAKNGHHAQAASVIHQVLSKSVRPSTVTQMPIDLIKEFSEIFNRINNGK